MTIFSRAAKLAAALALGLSLNIGSASANNIVETAQSAGQFQTLLAAAQAAGLADALSTSSPITVFAPTDEAFAKLPEGTVENLLKPENKDQLVAILTYHVLPRELTSDMLPARRIPVRTLNTGELLRVTRSHSSVTVDNSNVIQADIRADNGVIHVIDTVLLPGTNTH
ncbi:MAG: fasciclin domain-containing protein [Hyphomicrobiales bacterium]|nr:fasciclin domain-containing protein [Hyphomicrobiales bacterium]